METIKIIEKYFYILEMDKKYAEYLPKLREASEKYDLPILTSDEIRKIGCPELSLAWLIFKCGDLEKRYAALGIEESIFLDTISDIRIWTDTYFCCTGGRFGLGEINWLLYHIEFRLFKLGRLQFAFGKAEKDCTEKDFHKDECIIEIHIPEGGPLRQEDCVLSIKAAEHFFAKHFPEYKYRFYTCHSWLLDGNLKKLLKAGSNILKFAELFDIIDSGESYAGIKYIFGWTDTKESILEKEYPCGSLQNRMREYISSGGILEESYGIIKR